MGRGWFDAYFGRLWHRGQSVDLGTGINFNRGFSVTRNATTAALDIDVDTQSGLEAYGGGPGKTANENTQAFVRAWQDTRKIVLAAGTYRVNETVQIPANGMITGQGLDVSILRPVGCDGVKTVGACARACLRDLSIVGTDASAKTGIDLANVAMGAEITGVGISGFAVGLDARAPIGLTGSGVMIDGCVIGARFRGPELGVPYGTNNLLHGVWHTNGTAVQLLRGAQVGISGIIEANGVGIEMHPQGDLWQINTNDIWFEQNTTADVSLDLTGTPTNAVIWRLREVTAGTFGGMNRLGIKATDGQVIMQVSDCSVPQWFVPLAPTDAMTIDIADSVGPVWAAVGAKYSAQTVYSPKWAVALDAEVGVTGTSTVTGWQNSQDAQGSVVGVYSCELETSAPKRVRLTAPGGIVPLASCVRWVGRNEPIIVALHVVLDAPRSAGVNDVLFSMWEDSSNYCLRALIGWSSATAGEIYLARNHHGAESWAVTWPITYAELQAGKALYLAFDGTNLLIGDSVGIRAQTPAQLSVDVNPAGMRLGSDLVYASPAGLGFIRAAVLNNTKVAVWNVEHNWVVSQANPQRLCKFWEQLSA